MQKGDVIIFPTDTVYGMGAQINDPLAIQKIYDLKKRSPLKPLTVLFAVWAQVANFVQINTEIKQIMNLFWPGPLTLILKTSALYQKKYFAHTLGIRQPQHDLALALLKKYGPLKTTSVNESGQPPLNDYHMIYAQYFQQVSAIYPNLHPQSSQLSSTVLDVTNFNHWKILREGLITKAMLNQIVKIS